MRENKLIRLLKTLSVTEWKEFKKYITSPYFNGGRNYLHVYKYFSSIKRKKQISLPDPEIIYTTLYPGKAFNKDVVNTILSGFSKMLEGYLIQKNYDGSPNDKKLALIKELNTRDCYDLLNKETSRAERKIDERPFDLESLELLKNIQENIIIAKYNTNYDKTIEQDVHKRSDYRFFIFYLWLLNEERDLKVMKNVFNKAGTDRISTKINNSINSEFVLAYIEKYYPQLKNTVGLRILCHTSKDVFKILDTYYSSYHLLASNFAMNTAYVIEGLVVDMINEGNRNLLMERHKLHKFILEKKLVLNEQTKILNTRVTENIIYIAFWCGEHEWLNNFMDEWADSFAGEMRANYIYYIKACILYGKRKYNEALREINLMRDIPITLKLRTKDMELQILYELDETEQIYYHTDNYIKFRNNPLISDLNKSIMVSNINAYMALVKNSAEKTNLNQTVKEINKSLPSQFGDWIIKKITMK